MLIRVRGCSYIVTFQQRHKRIVVGKTEQPKRHPTLPAGVVNGPVPYGMAKISLKNCQRYSVHSLPAGKLSRLALLCPILVDQFLNVNGRDGSDSFPLRLRRAQSGFLVLTIDNDPL
jgi:hypothetical protein